MEQSQSLNSTQTNLFSKEQESGNEYPVWDLRSTVFKKMTSCDQKPSVWLLYFPLACVPFTTDFQNMCFTVCLHRDGDIGQIWCDLETANVFV